MIAVGAAVQPLGIPSPVAMSGFAARTAPRRSLRAAPPGPGSRPPPIRDGPL